MIRTHQFKAGGDDGGDNGNLNDQSAEVTRQQVAGTLEDGLDFGHQFVGRDGFDHVAKQGAVLQKEEGHENHRENAKE